MKLVLLGLLITLSIAGTFIFFQQTHIDSDYPPLSGVDNFNTTRYLGTWYEIAVIPYFWEYLCYGTKAIYTPRVEGGVTVENQCFIGSLKGELSTQYGKAVQQGDKPSELCVSFNIQPVCGPYWVIDLDQDNYSWSVVGQPSRSLLWILSRTKTMDDNLYSSLLQKATNQGFDVSKLKKTAQPTD